MNGSEEDNTTNNELMTLEESTSIIEVEDEKDDNEDIQQQNEDIEYAREEYLGLIGKNREAIDLAMSLGRETESPRVLEIVGQLLKSSAEITDRLVELHKSKKALLGSSKQQDDNNNVKSLTNNNVFVGSTDELQKMIKGL